MFGGGLVGVGACIVGGFGERDKPRLLRGVVDEAPQLRRVDAAADDLEDFLLTDERFAAVTGKQDADGFG